MLIIISKFGVSIWWKNKNTNPKPQAPALTQNCRTKNVFPCFGSAIFN